MTDLPDEELAGESLGGDRLRRGKELVFAVNGEVGLRALDALADVAPDLAEHIVAYGYGDVYSREGLTPKQRQLITIGILTSMGACESQLKVHTGSALNVGLTPTEIVETVIHAAVYCGFPRALNAIGVVKEVLAEHGLLPVPPAPRPASATNT